MNIYRPIHELMTTDLISVKPEAMISEVAEIFENNNFHHIPVISESNTPLGIISKHDYRQIQHHFTRQGWEIAESKNKRYFESLTAEEIMTHNPVTADKDDPLFEVVNIFLANLIHSIIVTDAGMCVGIITPHDILKEIKKHSVVMQ